jgi:hypothetical protein
MSCQVERYNPGYKEAWDQVVANGVNSALIHYRDFIAYHGDRFCEVSSLVFLEGKPVAVFPAEYTDKVVTSHQGLTFGGIIFSRELGPDLYREIIEAILNTYRDTGVEQMTIQVQPAFYWDSPNLASNQQAAFRSCGFHIVSQKVYHTLELPHQVSNKGRRWGIKKGKSHGLQVGRSSDLKRFWEKVLEPNLLQRHAAKPVHSLEEMGYLMSKFPESIQLWAVGDGKEMLGGCILFLHKWVAHCQYISSTQEGRKVQALDLLFSEMMERLHPTVRYLSFGTSIRPSTGLPDAGLVQWKESWGAIPYNTPTWGTRE